MNRTVIYYRLYALYRELYFSMGQPDAPAVRIGHILPTLREIAIGERSLEIQ